MNNNKYTIPPKTREEWEQIVTDKLEHRFRNFVLQMKSAEYNKKISSGALTPEQAIDDMYQICEKYAAAVQIDFKQIFKEW